MPDKVALLIVDIQNDFCPDGNLAVPNGDQVIPVLNEWIKNIPRLAGGKWDVVYASRDWHPQDSPHFKPIGKWPVHCVRGTWGAEFHSDLRLPLDVMVISKGLYLTGTSADIDGYSATEGTVVVSNYRIPFVEDLEREGIGRLYVGGLATDYCVRSSVLALLREGFEVSVISNGCRGVNIHPNDSRLALSEMQRAGAILVTMTT